ncbi:hypothetical protein [Mesorhizobium sp.]|uniref:hypothetical protein n=1 Tax=Mesorhizobium sp. TaxID=1871066 RepID=UPI0025F64FF0|nr:hypothetical protein [Mesorhizobium sp.]
MPRYFFHVLDGEASIDGEEASGGMMAECPWSMTVVDEDRKTVFTLAFQARKYF